MDPGYKTYLLLEVVKMFESHYTQEVIIVSFVLMDDTLRYPAKESTIQ